jgi:hypothetical protein
MKAEKENDDPNATNKNENQNLTPPFVVDLLTQEGYEEESIQSPSQHSTATNLGGWELGGWMNTPDNWIHVIQVCSTDGGGADTFVDRHALGEVASSLFRELTSQKSTVEKCG